jgi:hypothetical protein
MPLPPNPPRREPMPESQKRFRDKLIERWKDRHEVWPDRFDTGMRADEATVTYWGHRVGQDRWAYTTTRMFDGKFWSFRYRWVASRKDYVLVRSSVRRHAKRKDAKARSLAGG